jgi:hypothetical protein
VPRSIANVELPQISQQKYTNIGIEETKGGKFGFTSGGHPKLGFQQQKYGSHQWVKKTHLLGWFSRKM